MATAVDLSNLIVEVLHNRGDDNRPDWSVGSGFFVSKRLVLTALHNVDGPGELLVRVHGTEEHPAVVRLQGDRDIVDLAVLEVSDVAVNVSPLRYGAVDRSASAIVERCWAVGFPRFKERVHDPKPLRLSAQVNGEIPTGENWGQPLLTLRIRNSPRPLLGSAIHESEWAGMSGATVFSGNNIIVGVISEHHLPEGESALTVVPITVLDRLREAAQWWELLGVDRQAFVRLPPNERVIWRLLQRRKSVLLGIALPCGIALCPLLPLPINLIAENLSPAPFALLILALLSIGCFECIPFFFATASSPWSGFVVGLVGLPLSGWLTRLIAARADPNLFDFSSDQAFWPWILVGYGFLIGGSALLIGKFFVWRKTSHPAQNKPRQVFVIGGACLLFMITVYLVVAERFSQVAPALLALDPLLAVNGQMQTLGGNPLLSGVLLVLVGLLLLALLLFVYSSNWIRTHWKRWYSGALVGGLVFLIITSTIGYQFWDLSAASKDLQDQIFPLNIPLTTCPQCNVPYLQVSLDQIDPLDQSRSDWHISLTNSGVCLNILFQSITLTDSFKNIYRPILFSGLNHDQVTLNQGDFQPVSLRYQLVPKPWHHLQFAFSLRLTPCSGGGSSGEEVQGSQLLLFQ